MKRVGNVLFFYLFFMFFSIFASSFIIVSAQENDSGLGGVEVEDDDSDSDAVSESDVSADIETDVESFDDADVEDSDFEEDFNEDDASSVENEINFEEDVELETSEGITPDSALYFFDEFTDQFGDRIDVREEKIAEIRAMIQEGKIEEAKIALANYIKHAEELEREVSPEERERARESASAIYNVLKEIEGEIPEEYRGEFFDDIIEREGRIITAAEIASKIKELCEGLSELDPLEYSRVCKIDDNAPTWQQRLDRDLTDEQREEAKKFGKIMQQCFETAGQECACEEIPFADFAEACSIAAPLATACEIEGNDEACEQMDNLEMPELPDYLQDIMDDLENDVSGSRMDLHMPRECREAGATNQRDCMIVMVETHAPPECKQAILDSNVQSEREAREICEKIMFEQNAPFECVEAGLTNPKECGRFMFEQNAPQECIDAGLTGEHRNDPRKCEELMMELGGFDNRGHGNFRDRGFASGANCKTISNPEERLACYDGATQGINDFNSRFQETKERERMCAQSCLSQGGAWDFSNGECTCNFDNFREEFNSKFEGNFQEDFKDEFSEEFSPPEGFEEGEFIPFEDEFNEFDNSGEGSFSFGTGIEGSFEEDNSGSSDSSGGSSEEITSEESPDEITGSFITGNVFLDYRFG
ncbi:hypothetical protein J4407_02225 [Candidatus Pacearchaeota archaeon]|nr:hypothetical protein [Candidatus Pacearchaeota archaeon]